MGYFACDSRCGRYFVTRSEQSERDDFGTASSLTNETSRDFAVVFNVLANDRTGVLRRSRPTSAPTSLEQRLWFRQCQDFLETRIVAQRIPFPALSKVLKRDAVVSIIDRERCGEKMLDQLDRVIGIAVAGINQREKPLDCASVD